MSTNGTTTTPSPPPLRSPQQPSPANPQVDEGHRDFSTIDWLYDFEHKERKTRLNTRRTHRWQSILYYCFDCSQGWLAAALVGLIAGILAASIDAVTHWVTDLKLGVCVPFFWASQYFCCLHTSERECPQFRTWGDIVGGGDIGSFVMYTGLATAFATLAGFLCKEFAPYAAGSGIIEIKTILSGIRIRKYLNADVLFIKCVGLCLSVGSGLTLGKEGPFVHVGCCIGRLVARIFPKYRYHEANQRELLSASAAAGVAVAFGAPIGGVLFSLEEASYYFPHKIMLQSFFCAIISTLVLKKIDPTHTGHIVYFTVSYRHPWHYFELFGFAILGVMGGLMGAFIVSLNGYWCRLRRHSVLKCYPVCEVAVLAFLTAMFNFYTPFLKGGMLEMLGELFRDCSGDKTEGLCAHDELSTMLKLYFAGTVRMVFMCFTFGIKVPAGCFVPALFIGACYGRAVGLWVKGLQTAYHDSYIFSACNEETVCIIPGVYAIVGAAAGLAGVTRMTLCLVVIMFELTGGLEYVVPCMLVTVISKWVAELLGINSVYDVHLQLTQYPFLDPKLEFDADMTAAEVLTSAHIVTVCSTGWTLGTVKELLAAHPFKRFPVVAGNQNRTLVGLVSRDSLIHSIHEAELMNTGDGVPVAFTSTAFSRGSSAVLDWSPQLDVCPLQVTPDISVSRLLHIFKVLGVQHVLVARGAQLVGLISKKDIMSFLRRVEKEGKAHSFRGALTQWIGGGKRRGVMAPASDDEEEGYSMSPTSTPQTHNLEMADVGRIR
jgi:chloride channel 3/4/5